MTAGALTRRYAHRKQASPLRIGREDILPAKKRRCMPINHALTTLRTCDARGLVHLDRIRQGKMPDRTQEIMQMRYEIHVFLQFTSRESVQFCNHRTCRLPAVLDELSPLRGTDGLGFTLADPRQPFLEPLLVKGAPVPDVRARMYPG